jgi:hypothetical protein
MNYTEFSVLKYLRAQVVISSGTRTITNNANVFTSVYNVMIRDYICNSHVMMLNCFVICSLQILWLVFKVSIKKKLF